MKLEALMKARRRSEVACNCRIERYPSFERVTVADAPVFKDPAWEERKAPATAKLSKPQQKGREPSPRSVHRAKKRVFDIAALNDFRYFVTLTLDPERIDRESALEVSRKLKTFLSHKVSRKALRYLLVPELHKDNKGIHLHGLVSDGLTLADSGHKTKNGKTIYNLPEWSFGFSTCIELDENRQFVARYITKYISKDFRKLFGNFYYAGGRIKRNPPTLYQNAAYDDLDAEPYEVPGLGVRFKYAVVEGAREG